MSIDSYNTDVENLIKLGIYVAIPTKNIDEIVNMSEWEFADLDIETLLNYMGRIVQHIIFIQQELAKGKALELIAVNNFKRQQGRVFSRLTPEQRKGRNSIEERNQLVCEYDSECVELFNIWERAQIYRILLEDMPERFTEILNVLKKAHADKIQERGIV